MIMQILEDIPEFGIISSLFTSLTATSIYIEYVALIVGLFIAVVTAILKTKELIDVFTPKRFKRARKKVSNDD